MPIGKTTQITTSEALKLIEEARNAELCRDIPASQSILSAVWKNLDEEPTVKGLGNALQAEILRLCGFFLSYYGKAKNLKDYQERGKNLLTNAIEIFEAENLPDKSAEAKITLSLCYWYEGAVNESETILSQLEAEYSENTLNPVYLQICVNRLGIYYNKEEFEKSQKLIDSLTGIVQFSADWRLRTMYHNQAGLSYHKLNQPEKAIYHYKEALTAAKRCGNARFCALNYNNLGYIYKDISDFQRAHLYADKAIKCYRKLGEVGWLAHIFDTKALVYLAENRYKSALNAIDEALHIFRKGEDFAGLVESLFTKCKILVRLERGAEAVELCGELIETAKQRIGDFAVKKYADEFFKLMYPFNNTSYSNEVKAFKTSLLRKHLTEANGQVTKAAETLGISHQALSDILNNQFPELFIELGIRRRSRRNGKRRDILKNIAPIKLSDSQISYNSSLRLNEESSYYTFVLNGKRLPSLKTKQNVVVLVEASEQTAGATVIMQNQKTNEFHCGVLEMDKLTGIFYLNDSAVKDGFPFLLDDFKYYGKVVGYCLIEEDSGIEILFRPF